MTATSAGSAADNRIVRIEAPARLHLGFIDVSGNARAPLRQPRTDVRGAYDHAHLACVAPSSLRRDRRRNVPARICAGCSTTTIRRSAPPMRCSGRFQSTSGLGSGTQLALAVGRRSLRCSMSRSPASTLAARLDRGARSGIGIGAFEQGGFVIDGGRGPRAAIRR